MDDAVLYFQSIPKTASTTLYHILASFFLPEQVAPIQPISHLMTVSREQVYDWQLVGGHFYWNIAPILGCEPIRITMLRNPIDRAISYYHHIRRAPRHYAHERVVDQTLDAYLSDLRNHAHFRNLMVRSLGQFHDLSAQHRIAVKRNESFECRLEAYGGCGDRTMLETAWERVSSFLWVGLQERFDETLALLCRQMGWQMPDDYTSHLRFEYSTVGIEAAVERLTDYNALDLELYQRVCELVKTRLYDSEISSGVFCGK